MSVISLNEKNDLKSKLSRKKKTITTIVVLAGCHFVLYIIAGIAEFDTGSFLFKNPEPSHSFWVTMLLVLEFPLITLCRLVGLPENDFYLIVFIINSFLWAAVLHSGYKFIKRKSD